MEDAPETVNVFSNEDIAILRNGKAKKNDPPVPADLAPISGAGKRVRKEKAEEPAFLDPIKFRYREDAVVEAAPAEMEEASEELGESRQNRRRRNRKPRTEGKPAQEEMVPVEVPEISAEQDEKTKKSNNRRRYHYHRRKPKSGGEQN
jgi:hypothetical protein